MLLTGRRVGPACKAKKTVIGYGDVPYKSREEARELMEQAGYSSDKRLRVKVSTRSIALLRDPATILLDQLRHSGSKANSR